MCKAPKPPAPKEPDKPEWLRNPYLDAAIGQSGLVDQLRSGRSSLRINIGSNLGIRQPGQPIAQPNPNTRGPGNPPRQPASTNPLDQFRGVLPSIAALRF